MTDVPTLQLNDGTTLPAVGFGTGGLRGDDGLDPIVSALRQGYRLIDSAVRYENEGIVGEALRRSGLPRAQVALTSKLPGRHHAYAEAVRTVKESVYRMGVDHLDLYLIHWPNPRRELFVEAWQALVDLRAAGVVRSIGVCNFLPDYLDTIIAATGVTPAVNQIEVHPYFNQPAVRAGNDARGVRTQSWAPIGRLNGVRADQVVAGIAREHGRTPAQVVLRWQVQLGCLPIPKSTDAGRQRENLGVFDFDLDPDEVAALSALDSPDGRVSGLDPAVYEDVQEPGLGPGRTVGRRR